MGKINNLINHYLSDNRRFADLINGICFHGEAVICAGGLSEGICGSYTIRSMNRAYRTFKAIIKQIVDQIIS